MNLRHLRAIVAPNPSAMTLGGTNSYLVGESVVLVIDPGPMIASHLDVLESLLEASREVRVVATHHHADHAGAAEELTARLGSRNRPVVIRTGSATLRPRGSPETAGERLPTDAGPVRAIATPGHTGDHISFLWERRDERVRRVAFVGDLLLGEGDTALVAAPEGSVSEYLASLDLIESLRPDLLLPGHGAPLEDPPAAITRFRCHRRQRVEQVRRTMVENPTADVATVVERIYGDSIPDELRAAASRSVAAAMEYLRFSGTSGSNG